ncbi:MAG TPA: glycosyltransferase [Candidatus Altiarchaeales archaeon]|nr:glycosyltransferase [Candidatus Altiarchaeales archaeon]
MDVSIDSYRDLVGDQVVEDVAEKAAPLSEKHILHINSTYQGGGVAELLSSLVLLMNDLGIDTGWRILHGNSDFFVITKKFHNALQGAGLNLTDRKKKIYERVNENFSKFTHIDHDLVVVHDPQPLPLIHFYEKKQPWLWRLHIDLSHPSKTGRRLFEYMNSFISCYDRMIVSMDAYRQDVNTLQKIIMPSIDPFSNKNKYLRQSEVEKILSKAGIDSDKPIITQVSRFDKFKDPEGVIKVYKNVRKKTDCRLVLIGGMAMDDPESERLYKRILRQYGEDEDIFIYSATNDVLVNALQRQSACVIQKSLREGFALTVSEALWKGTPVVASNVGGIPAQVVDGKNGYLVGPRQYKKCADRIVKILEDEKRASKMGEYGREHVKKNFLMTRQLSDYLDLFNSLLKA